MVDEVKELQGRENETENPNDEVVVMMTPPVTCARCRADHATHQCARNALRRNSAAKTAQHVARLPPESTCQLQNKIKNSAFNFIYLAITTDHAATMAGVDLHLGEEAGFGLDHHFKPTKPGAARRVPNGNDDVSESSASMHFSPRAQCDEEDAPASCCMRGAITAVANDGGAPL